MALEAVDKSWIPELRDPADAPRFGLHKLPPQDVDGLPEMIELVRYQDSASGVEARAMLTCEAGYQGFRLARRLEGEDLGVVACNPASLEAVRKNKAKAGRIDAVDGSGAWGLGQWRPWCAGACARSGYLGGGREAAAAPSGTSGAGAITEHEHDRRVASTARVSGEAPERPGSRSASAS
ncbi:MAG: hypothetical protein OXN84_18270 [Albidovulum sp.]|nr:hypothetical protein [Albidovulum sp.]